MPQYKILGLSLSFEGKEFPFDKRLSIGRSDDNEVVVKAPGISRHHAEIVVQGSVVMVKDLGSANGTKVNGDMVIHKQLSSGDRVSVAECEFLFLAPSEQEIPEEPTSKFVEAQPVGDETAFIDMSGVIGKTEVPPPSPNETAFVDMKEVMKESGQQSAPQSTEYVDMRQLIAENKDSEAPSPAQQTSFIDMNEVLKQQPVQEAVGNQTAFIDMNEVIATEAAKDPGKIREYSPFLLVSKSEGTNISYRIPYGDSILGRDPSCDLVVTRDSVSMKHAMLTYDGNNLLIEDIGAAPGIFVNLEKVLTPRIVKPGDEILLGRFTLYCRRAVSDDSVIIEVSSVHKKSGCLGWLYKLLHIKKK